MLVVWNVASTAGTYDWNDPANWTNGSVPQDSDDVLLPNYGSPYTVTINSSIATPFIIEVDAAGYAPITIALAGGTTLAPEAIGQTDTGATVQLSQASTLIVQGVQGIADPTALPSPVSAVDVQFLDGSASELDLPQVGYQALHSPLDPYLYNGTITGFGGRNQIGVSVINSMTYFSFAQGTGGGTLNVYQPGIDPFYQTNNTVLYTALAVTLNFTGTYRQSDFRLSYAPQSPFGVINYIPQTTTATGPNIVQGTSGADALNVHGSFKSIYGNGGNDSFSITGSNDQALIGDSTTSQEIVTLAGVHDIVQGSGGTVTVQASGGSNNFILGDGYTASATYDITALGSYNKFVLDDHATNIVAAGSGADIAIGGAGDGARGLATVTLTGLNNTLNVGDGDAVVTGGTGYATLDFGAGTDTIAIGGQHNRVLEGAGTGTIDPGSGNDVVTLAGAAAHVTFHGANNMLFVGSDQPGATGTSGTIDGSLQQLRISVVGAIGAIKIVGDMTGQSVFINGVPTADAAALTSDGADGTILFTHGGSIDFVNTPNLSSLLFDPNARVFHT